MEKVFVKYHKYTNDSVKKGALVCTAYYWDVGKGSLWQKLFDVYSPADGFLEKAKPIKNNAGDEYYSENSELFTVLSYEETYNSIDFYYKIEADPYTKNKKIVWEGSSNRFGLAFEYNNGVFLTLKVRKDYFRPKKKDKSMFLFEDGDVFTFDISEQPIKDQSDYIIKFALTKPELEKFCSVPVTSVRLESKTVAPYEFKLWARRSNELGKSLFMKYATRFSKALDEIEYVWPEQKEDFPATPDEPCFVYLMVDAANGYHKIGISNHPEYREGTLQSEKPTIELLCAKQFPSRVIAKAIESALHKTYEAKHLRGEWFQLDAKDIIDLMATLK